MHGRMSCSGKIYCRSKIKGLPLVSQRLISACPTMERVQSCLHQAQRRTKVQKFCAISSLHPKA